MFPCVAQICTRIIDKTKQQQKKRILIIAKHKKKNRFHDFTISGNNSEKQKHSAQKRDSTWFASLHFCMSVFMHRTDL